VTLVPVRIPPGMFGNGTEYSAKNRWFRGSLVRWFGGALRAIGGWEPMRKSNGTAIPLLVANPVVETVRDAYSWTAGSSLANSIYASNLNVFYMDPSNDITNITSLAMTPALNQPSDSTGYGTGLYGRGTYGTPRVNAGSLYGTLRRWTFDAWGADVLASYEPGNEGLLRYVAGAARLVLVPNAPTVFANFSVTPQRFVMLVGANGVYNRVKWSDREDSEQWNALVTNEAGEIDLQTNGPLTYIGRVLNQMLILGLDAYVGRYIGPPYVYGFDLVGRDCQPVHPKAVVCTDRFAIWLGNRSFWLYDGTIRAIESEIIDFVINDINNDMISKIVSLVNSTYNEVWWFYQSKSSATNEIDAYFSFDYVRNIWHYGKLDRTAGFDRGVYKDSVYVSKTGQILFHELAAVVPPGAYAETGPLELGDGERNMVVRAIYPDGSSFGDFSLTLLGKSMPNATEYAYGPYAFNNPIPVRADGRQIRLRLTGEGAAWEFGTARFDITQGGAR
jgi:hypothetical protein